MGAYMSCVRVWPHRCHKDTKTLRSRLVSFSLRASCIPTVIVIIHDRFWTTQPSSEDRQDLVLIDTRMWTVAVDDLVIPTDFVMKNHGLHTSSFPSARSISHRWCIMQHAHTSSKQRGRRNSLPTRLSLTSHAPQRSPPSSPYVCLNFYVKSVPPLTEQRRL